MSGNQPGGNGNPFDDIRSLAATLPGADETAQALALERAGQGFRHGGEMGWLAAWSGKSPDVSRPVTVLFAGTHRVAARLRRRDEPTTQEIATAIGEGKAAVSQACGVNGIGLKLFDLALPMPVGDILTGVAFNEKECAGTIGFGMEAIAGGADALAIAGFGDAAQEVAAAIFMLLHGGEAENWLPAGVSAESVSIVREAAALHGSSAGDPLEILRRVGGREFAALAGALLASRSSHVPAVIEGEVALAVAALLEAMQPGATAHCRLAARPASTVVERMAGAAGICALPIDASGCSHGCDGALALTWLRSLAAIHGADHQGPDHQRSRSM